jgi:hypothetical protein
MLRRDLGGAIWSSEVQMEDRELGRRISEYCAEYRIPREHLLDILNDQKVVPMLRGKGMEYECVAVLGGVLNPGEWIVEKLNLSPQPGTPDQDIGVTYRRTGTRLVLESKSAVRGSFATGERARNVKVPHFRVKCHRSRSNIAKAATSNDRYRGDEFDVVLSNPLNALYGGKALGAKLELVRHPGAVEALMLHYNAGDETTLADAASADWRFVVPSDIVDGEGYIPRTPTVLLSNDPHWRPLAELEARLAEVVRAKLRG